MSLSSPALTGGFFTTRATWEAPFSILPELNTTERTISKSESWLLGPETLGKRPKVSGLHFLTQDRANHPAQPQTGTRETAHGQHPGYVLAHGGCFLPLGLVVCVASWQGAGLPPTQTGSGRAGGTGSSAKDRGAERHAGAGCLLRHSIWNASPFTPASEVSALGSSSEVSVCRDSGTIYHAGV